MDPMQGQPGTIRVSDLVDVLTVLSDTLGVSRAALEGLDQVLLPGVGAQRGPAPFPCPFPAGPSCDQLRERSAEVLGRFETAESQPQLRVADVRESLSGVIDWLAAVASSLDELAKRENLAVRPPKLGGHPFTPTASMQPPVGGGNRC